jgi:hypothetical protein
MWAVVVGALTAALMGAASSGADNAARPAASPDPPATCGVRAPAPGDWVRPEDDPEARPLCRAPEPAAARARVERARRRI